MLYNDVGILGEKTAIRLFVAIILRIKSTRVFKSRGVLGVDPGKASYGGQKADFGFRGFAVSPQQRVGSAVCTE